MMDSLHRAVIMVLRHYQLQTPSIAIFDPLSSSHLTLKKQT